jgi:hypothetical protein
MFFNLEFATDKSQIKILAIFKSSDNWAILLNLLFNVN